MTFHDSSLRDPPKPLSIKRTPDDGFDDFKQIQIRRYIKEQEREQDLTKTLADSNLSAIPVSATVCIL